MDKPLLVYHFMGWTGNDAGCMGGPFMVFHWVYANTARCNYRSMLNVCPMYAEAQRLMYTRYRLMFGGVCFDEEAIRGEMLLPAAAGCCWCAVA